MAHQFARLRSQYSKERAFARSHTARWTAEPIAEQIKHRLKHGDVKGYLVPPYDPAANEFKAARKAMMLATLNAHEGERGSRQEGGA